MKTIIASIIASLLLASAASAASSVTITAPPPSTVQFEEFNPYVGQQGSFSIGGKLAGQILGNADVVHAPNLSFFGNNDAYMLLDPTLNPPLCCNLGRSHAANFTLNLTTPVKTLSVLLSHIQPTNSVQFGSGTDTVTVTGAQLMATGLTSVLVTFTSDTPFNRVQVHDVDATPYDPTFARFMIGQIAQ